MKAFERIYYSLALLVVANACIEALGYQEQKAEADQDDRADG